MSITYNPNSNTSRMRSYSPDRRIASSTIRKSTVSAVSNPNLLNLIPKQRSNNPPNSNQKYFLAGNLRPAELKKRTMSIMGDYLNPNSQSYYLKHRKTTSSSALLKDPLLLDSNIKQLTLSQFRHKPTNWLKEQSYNASMAELSMLDKRPDKNLPMEPKKDHRSAYKKMRDNKNKTGIDNFVFKQTDLEKFYSPNLNINFGSTHKNLLNKKSPLAPGDSPKLSPFVRLTKPDDSELFLERPGGISINDLDAS
jgi:hypothetical protein